MPMKVTKLFLLSIVRGLLRNKRLQLDLLILVALAILSGVGLVQHTLAQSGESSWSTPTNISRSGAASSPVIAAAPDGKLHALWWDSAEGEEYAQTTNVTGTVWTEPVVVPQIFGARRQVTNQDTGKAQVTLVPPLQVRLLSDLQGNLYAFWLDAENQLLSAQLRGAAWSKSLALADSAVSPDTVVDVKGTVHLAYVQTLNTDGNPSGIYYRTTTGADWSAPVLVQASLYFRTVKADDISLSVAGDGAKQVIIVWDDPEQGQSFYARSADNGRTWSKPQLVSDDPASGITRARVAFAPSGDFFLLWEDSSAETCGLKLRRSTDGGQNWSAAERASTDMSRCPGRWQFSSSAGGRLWLIGLPLLSQTEDYSNLATLVTWNGQSWSQAVDVSLSFQDMTSRRTVNLSNLDLALLNASAGIIGTDGTGDVWAARNTTGLDRLITVSKPAWQLVQLVSDQGSSTQVQDVPAFVADQQGKLYALWSESPDQGGPGTGLYMAVWDGVHWSRATRLFLSISSTTNVPGSNAPVSLAEHPSLTLDSQGRLHAVWRAGSEGEIEYSWAFARDATSPQAWIEPVALPAVGHPGSWPDIVVDPRTDTLHVIYAVPYNEGRGIYYVRSNDGGTTWSTPTVVFDAVAAQWDSVDKPRLALDAETGVLHVVWLQTGLVGEAHGRTIMYSRSVDGGRTWSTPIKVAEGVLDWPRVATVGAGQAVLVWNQIKASSGMSAASMEVWGQFSGDGGQRWTKPTRVVGFENVTGPVGLTSDGARGLYLVGVGRGNDGEAALLYSRWDGQAWSAREVAGLGQDAVPGNGAAAALIPSQGKLEAALREFVRAPDGNGQFRLLATGRDVPVSLTLKPVPTFTPLPTLTPMATLEPIPTATPRPLLLSTDAPQGVQKSALPISTSVVVGGALIAVISLGVVISRVVWMNRP